MTTGTLTPPSLVEFDRDDWDGQPGYNDEFEQPTPERHYVVIGSGHRKEWPQGYSRRMPYSFETVLILVIEDDEIVDVIDRSQRAAEWRELIARTRGRSPRETIVHGTSAAELHPYSWLGKEDWFFDSPDDA